VDLLKWLDLDSQTLTALIIGGAVVLIIAVLALRSLLSSRLVVIVGGALAVGAIAPGVLGALGNLIGGLLGGLIPLVVIVIGSVFALLIVLNRNPDLREWLRPLLPRRPPTSVETSAWPTTSYTVTLAPHGGCSAGVDASRNSAMPALPAPTKRAKHRSQHLHDWGF
jgi:hypothetical protein